MKNAKQKQEYYVVNGKLCNPYVVNGKYYQSKHAQRIASVLAEHGELTHQELAEYLGISTSNLTYVIQKLPDLVQSRKIGIYTLYSLKIPKESIKSEASNISFLEEILLKNVLISSEVPDALIILDNLDLIGEIMSFSDIVKLLHFKGIIDISFSDFNTLMSEEGTTLEDIRRKIIGKYQLFLQLQEQRSIGERKLERSTEL